MNTDMKKTQKKNSKGNRIISLFGFYFFLSIMLIITVSYLLIKNLYKDLPRLEALEKIYDEQSQSTIIYSSDGEILTTLAKEKRFWITFDRIPKSMIDAVLAIEDQRFFKHWGVSFPDILRALKEDIITMSFKQGASTITQQLAKKLYFGPVKTIKRKLNEMLTAIQIEKTYTKSEILEMYLNKMSYANNLYGIQAAAQVYFSKNAAELNISESALLAGILQNPTRHNPRSQLERNRRSALTRRNLVLRMMAKAGKIPLSVALEEMGKPIQLAEHSGPVLGKAYHFTEYVRNALIDKYNKEYGEEYGEEYVKTSGLRVYTTLDYRLQKVAEDSLKRHLDYIQKNYADKQIIYERPEGLTDVEAYKDSLDKTVVQGALVALDVKSGKILAMIGGVGYEGLNFFNRVTQALRQPGSSFKPFVYTAAIDNGWRCSDTILDSYVCYEDVDGQGTFWEPQNFEKEFKGLTSLRDGLKLSVNIVAIKLMNDRENRGIGPQNVIKYARKMGITTLLNSDAVPSLAIGTCHLNLLEMVSANTVFPNLGEKTETFSVNTIYDKNDNLIFSQPNEEGAKSEVLDPAVASLMLSMLKSVTTDGTARNIIKIKGMNDRPSAGKTGTGNDYKDAWFIGFTPYIACGVWVGFDSEESTLGGNAYGTGAVAALPIWVGFIKEASEILGYPKNDFMFSSDITNLRICKDSYLKATPSCPVASTYTEYFVKGTEITESCHLHRSWRMDSGDQRYNPNNRKKRGF
ncbi:MAG TPA: PBP1A family penicillin-binding protein [bacterium]|nr:PBP1A family penicillin-binding protein [bacterium]